MEMGDAVEWIWEMEGRCDGKGDDKKKGKKSEQRKKNEMEDVEKKKKTRNRFLKLQSFEFMRKSEKKMVNS